MVAVIGANSPIGLTVIRELGERGVKVLAAGSKPNSLGKYSRHTTAYEVIETPLHEWLPRMIAKYDLGAVLAISEGQLIELAKIKNASGDCTILVPDADKLALVLDKQRTLDLAATLGISVPISWQPEPGEDHAAKIAGLSFPVAIKWADPNLVADRLDAAGVALEKVEYADNAAQLASILKRYDSIGGYPLVQSYCPGHGLGQMLHMHDGRATLKFQHQRLREWPPTGGVSTLCETVPLDQHAEQMALSERLLAAMGWEGPAMVEYRYDPATSTYWLMEINGRFWGSIPLAYNAGAHFAWESYRCAVLGEDGEPQPPSRQRTARYAIPDTKHLFAVLRDGERSLGERCKLLLGWLGGFLSPTMRYYVWSWRDPKPMFGDLAGIFSRRRG